MSLEAQEVVRLEEKRPIIGTLPKNSIISVESLAAYLGCSVEGLKKWLSRNSDTVRYRSVNGKWIVDVDSLLESRPHEK